MTSFKRQGLDWGWPRRVLFCVTFLGIAGYAGRLGYDALCGYVAMRSWNEVVCTIEWLDLETYEGDEGGVTYRLKTRYHYTVDGVTRIGSRVSIHSDADNVGPFDRYAHAQLLPYQKSGKPFRCYVNPANPSEAILYRQPRWESIALITAVVVIFGGGGLYVLWVWTREYLIRVSVTNGRRRQRRRR